MKIIFLISFILTLSACATTTEQFLPIPQTGDFLDKPQIILMRENTGLGIVNGADVWDGKNLIASVGAGGYIHWSRDPGETVVRIRKAGISIVRISKSLKFHTQSGKKYYIFATKIPFVGYSLKLIDATKGKSMLKEFTAPIYIKNNE